MRILVLLLVLAFMPAGAFAQQTIKVDPTAKPATAPEPEAKQTEDIINRYGFHMKGSNTRVQVVINGVPLILKSLFDEGEMDVSFNEWIKIGQNVLEVRLERLDAYKPYRVEYETYYQSPTQIISGERQILMKNAPEVSLPLRQAIGIRIQTAPRLRIWRTEKVGLTEERAGVIKAVNAMRDNIVKALEKGDTGFLATYDRDVRDEKERAYGRPLLTADEVQEKRIGIAKKLAKLSSVPVEATPEIKPEEVDMELIGNGYLVRITRKDRLPLIKITRGELEYALERPIFGLIGGLWTWLR